MAVEWSGSRSEVLITLDNWLGVYERTVGRLSNGATLRGQTGRSGQAAAGVSTKTGMTLVVFFWYSA